MTTLLLDRSQPPHALQTRAERTLPWCVSALIHFVAAAVGASVVTLTSLHRSHSAVVPSAAGTRSVDSIRVVLPRVLFRSPYGAGGGGGGGGNDDPRPIRHATGHGRDAATLRTRPHDATTDGRVPASNDLAPTVFLDARSLASGDSEQAGLPVGGVSFGTSLGPGSGGGVGSGRGTGIGPGDGPGIGPGSGGGTGGGAYTIGSGVTAPRLLVQTTPRYTADALERRIQGTVSLDVVIARDGTPVRIRVVRSLDDGLDREAIEALRQWRFAPGVLAGSPVDVEVVVLIDFWIR